MVVDVDSIKDGENEVKQKIQEIIVENACQEYNANVKQTLDAINRRLDEALVENYADLENLEEKIAARTNYLEKNPKFLSSLKFTTHHIKIAPLREFDEIRITLKEHSRRIIEKVEEIENYHDRLFELVVNNSKQNLHWLKSLEELDDEMFQDCLDRMTEKEVLMSILEDDFLDNAVDGNPGRKDSITAPDNQESKTDLHSEVQEDYPEEKASVNDPNTTQAKTGLQSKDLEDEESEDPPNTPIEETEHETIPIESTPKEPSKLDHQPNTNSENTTVSSTQRPKTPKTKPPNKPATKAPEKDPSSGIKSDDSFDIVTIQKNAYSEVSLHSSLRESLPSNFQLFPDVIPEVHRRKPFEDLHQKLLQQVQASDSLEGFIKLMERKPGVNKTIKNGTIERKYAGSLWFFPEKTKKGSTVSTNGSQKSPKVGKVTKDGTCSSICNLLVTSSQTPSIPNKDKMRKTKSNLEKSKLKYYDLLDDVNGKDLKPIKSEYPRKDNVYECKKSLKGRTTYLQWMLKESDNVWKKLLQPTVAKNEEKKKSSKKKKSSTVTVEASEQKIQKKSVKSLHSTTSTDQKNKTTKHHNVKSLIEYLTSPEQRFLNSRPQTLIVMPVKVFYDNFPTRELPVVNEIDNSQNPEVPIEYQLNNIHTAVRQITHPLPVKPAEVKPFSKLKSPNRTDSGLKKTEDNIPLPVKRKQEILQQLKGLKIHNDNIQKNIQKAIDVIEEKMVVLLSSPSGDTNSEAFNAMEEEITKVLQLMNESDKKEMKKTEKKDTNTKKVEKMEAEKDDSHKSPKLKRAITTIVKKNSDLSSAKIEAGPPATPKNKDEKKTKKECGKNGKINEEVRRAANIEEGERLLGQVDSVIKKIDSIYTKFYDDNKIKSPKEKPKVEEGTLKNVLHFFDSLTSVVDPSKAQENLAGNLQKPDSSVQMPSEQRPTENKKLEETKKEEAQNQDETQKNELKMEEDLKKQEELKLPSVPQEAEETKNQEEETKRMEELQKQEEIKQKEEMATKEQELKEKEEEKRVKEEMEKEAAKPIELKQNDKTSKTEDELIKKLDEEIRISKEMRKVEKMRMEEFMKSHTELKKSEDEMKTEEFVEAQEEIEQEKEMKTTEFESMAEKNEDDTAYEIDEEAMRECSVLQYIKEDYDRHESTLKFFYALFFSSIYFALNFDFAAL